MNRWAYCKECGKVFETEHIHMQFEYGDGKCPTEGCKGNAFGIDENMIIPIMLLNKKGYDTKWTCSGHVFEPIQDAYIVFASDKSFPDTLPVGWYKDDECQNCIRVKNSGRKVNPVLRQMVILKNMENLLEWAVALPNNP